MELDTTFEALGKHHDRMPFSCGKESLDRYLHLSALRDQSSGIARVFVLSHGSSIIGYYTLHQHAISAEEMPQDLKKRLSHYAGYPATLIGRLAVHARYAHRGFGRDILYDALHRAILATAQVASYAVVVEALDEEAQSFYEHYGFVLLNAEKRRLCVSGGGRWGHYGGPVGTTPPMVDGSLSGDQESPRNSSKDFP